jgi:hypothetical protein
MTGRTVIYFGHLTLLDQIPDAGGWSFVDLTNWFGNADNKVPGVPRPQDHGDFRRTRSLRSSRVMSFVARFDGDSSAEVEAAFDEFAAIGAEAPAAIGVETEAGITWRTVAVERSLAEPTYNLPFGTIPVDLTADDSRRYGLGEWQQTTPPAPGQGLVWPVVWPAVWPGGGSTGRVTLLNAGRAPSPTVFELRGGFSSALITCVETGARVALARPVPEGSVVTIDSSTRRAVIDGQSDVSRWLRFREWTDVPGLMSRTFQFDATDPVGSPTMRGKADPAWW